MEGYKIKKRYKNLTANEPENKYIEKRMHDQFHKDVENKTERKREIKHDYG